MKEYKRIAKENSIRFDSWIAGNFSDISRSNAKNIIVEGLATVNGEKAKASTTINKGDRIIVNVPDQEATKIIPQDIPLDIIYEDKDIIVVNKDRGMVVHPAVGNRQGTLVNALLFHYTKDLSGINGIERPGIVHRIDKDTSGVLVVAKNDKAHNKLAELFVTHDIDREYIALVKGVINEDNGKIKAPIGRHKVDRKKMWVDTKNGKDAITHFEVIQRFENETLIKVNLETGRTHQIRVHMSYIGYPVIGDPQYSKVDAMGMKGQALHARLLGFIHPTTGEHMSFQAPMPKDMEDLIAGLRRI